jgi:hypothetical protein
MKPLWFFWSERASESRFIQSFLRSRRAQASSLAVGLFISVWWCGACMSTFTVLFCIVSCTKYAELVVLIVLTMNGCAKYELVGLGFKLGARCVLGRLARYELMIS